MSLKQTHTFSILEISQAAYEEIKDKLIEAGYQQTIMEENGQEVIAMQGIGLTKESKSTSVDIKNMRQHCGHRAEYLYRDVNNDLRCSVCGQLR